MYEYLDGGEIMPEAKGHKLPVPPQAVREKNRFPRKYQLDCLHKDRSNEHAATFHEVGLKYVKGYADYSRFGRGPILIGPARADASKTAAAIANEILMRYGNRADMTAGWLSGFWMLRMILDAKQMNRSETYTTLRNQMFNHSVLVVDDLLSAVECDGGKSFMETVYAFRYDHRLPTITTLSTPEAGCDTGPLIDRAFGKKFRERLSLTTTDLVAKI